MAIKLPVATPPPLAMAADDIIPAATEPAVIPATVNPAAPIANGINTAEPTETQTHN